MYWKKEPSELKHGKVSRRSILATSILVSAVILLGLFAGPVIGICEEAARQILEPELYIQSVLGG